MEIKAVATVPRPRNEYKDFTPFEIEFIQKRTKDARPGKRMTARELAKFPEMSRHTRQSIATKIKKLGFAPVEHNRVKSARRFTKKAKREVVRFLRNEGRYWPSENVAQRFGYSHAQIVRLRFFYELQVKHSEKAMQDPVYKKWYNDREKKRIRLLKLAFALRPQVRQQDLDAKVERLIALGVSIIKTKVCSICKKRRPRTSEFFKTCKRFKASGEEYHPLRAICHACNYPRKRKKKSKR